MTQATLEFAASSPDHANLPRALAGNLAGAPHRAAALPARSASELEAYSIGWDHARHGLTPALRHLHPDNPIRQGWETAKPIFAGRTVKPTVAHQQWLQLRMQAWSNGHPIDDIQVNPSYMAQIDTPFCPITRQPLTHFTEQARDAVVARLNPRAHHEAGNLVVVSRQALEATQCVPSWQAALQHAQQDQPTGLTSDAWQRWAVMMTFAQEVPHAQAACLPLCALPPNRVRVVNVVQSVQVMLTLQFTKAGYARRLLELAALLPHGEIRQAFQIFMHTLLARRLSVGATATAQDARHALEDAWLDPLVNRRWQRLSWHLTEAMCEQWLRRASQRGLMVGGMQWLQGDSEEPASPLGAPPAAGRSRAARPETRQAYAAAASGVPTPGIARSLGSQKLAN